MCAARKQAEAAITRPGRPGVRDRALAQARAQLGAANPALAIQTLRPLIRKGKADGEALYLTGVAYRAGGDLVSATDYARRSIKAVDNAHARLLLASCLRAKGETEKCVAACDAAMAAPALAEQAMALKGAALEEAGRFDEARPLIEPLAKRPCRRESGAIGEARLVWAKLLVHDGEHAEAIKVVESIVEQSTDEKANCLALHLAAKAADRSKDYAAAFAYAQRANEIGKVTFDPELYEQQVSALIDNWSADAMARFPLSSYDSEIPVFIAGMPRSGTSLIDQIIDAHPNAAGVGELSTIEQFAVELSRAWDQTKEPPACFGRYTSPKWTQASRRYVRQITKLSPNASRIVNKSLGNNKLVGLLARLFPKTRVIHAIRDPRDVAISCFMGGFNNDLHAWTTQIDWVASAWAQSMRMMDHWKHTLDVPILDVHYERLVNDPAAEFPRIIEFLGLDWNDSCRAFHERRRTVRTLSYDQVNRPLYTTSVGRHRHYAPMIEGVTFPAYDP